MRPPCKLRGSRRLLLKREVAALGAPPHPSATKSKAVFVNQTLLQAARANLRGLKLSAFFWAREVSFLASKGVRRRRKARVFFYLKS